MGSNIIIFILAIIVLSYNILKKNNIKLNLIMIFVPIILTIISIFYHYDQTSSAREMFMQSINFISSILSLILTIISILYVIKNRKDIKSSKSVLLIGIVLSYVCISILSKPIYVSEILTYDYFRRLYKININIGSLFIMQITLFTNLISNNKKTSISSNITIENNNISSKEEENHEK